MIVWKNVVLREKKDLPVRHRKTRIGRELEKIGRGLEKTHKPCYDEVQNYLRMEKERC